jgi:IS5 family transposase
VNRQLEAKGLMLKRGTLIDATVVETAAARPSPAEAVADRVDPDAAFLKREGKGGSSYGYKAHVAVDEGSLLVRVATLTPANVTDTEVADALILATADAPAVYADRAYDSHARRALLVELGLADHIMRRGNKHHALPAEARAHNAAAAKVRSRVETVFALLKRRYGFRRTRYVGLIRNQLQLTLLAVCFNLRRALALDRQARSPSPA